MIAMSPITSSTGPAEVKSYRVPLKFGALNFGEAELKVIKQAAHVELRIESALMREGVVIPKATAEQLLQELIQWLKT